MSEKLLGHKHNVNSKWITHRTAFFNQLKYFVNTVELDLNVKCQFELLLVSNNLKKKKKTVHNIHNTDTRHSQHRDAVKGAG